MTNTKTPLGANYIDDIKSVEFKLFSKNATKVFLCIFDAPVDESPVMELEMTKTQNGIWHTYVKDYILNCSKKPIFYGYRVFGPNWEFYEKFEEGSNIGFISKFDEKGNRFNPNKIAYDPYSKELSHTPGEVDKSYSAFRTGDSLHLRPSAKSAPKSVFKLTQPVEVQQINPRPFSSEVIGEVHIKDLTQKLDIEEKGTFSGAAGFVETLKEIGVTMVEFLPLNEFDSHQHCGNYWGYMPLSYFSLKRDYAFDKTRGTVINEFCQMVDIFHKNGIKVCLDMVYNHTGEAGLVNNNPDDAVLLSYAAIDNSSYYKVYKNGYYRSNSGCGNDFNANQTGVLDLIIDSLVFWINLGVDAFRFDLAAALLENSCNCEEIYDNIDSLAARLKDKLNAKGINVIDNFSKSEKGVILIAEPWTCGGKNCYHLGNFPSFWAEWNDVSRDTLRKITIRPQEVTPYQLRELVEGSPNIFSGVNKSINYIASHDGFCLFDLNNYNKKSPLTDGGSNWEICSDYNRKVDYQKNAIRKQLALLFLSYGIPMIQIGDIIAHTKHGNNNSYNKDDETNYLDWTQAFSSGTFQNQIMQYTTNLIRFRKENPVFWDENFKNLTTYHYDNGEIASIDNKGYWDNTLDFFFGYCIKSSERIYICSNKGYDKLNIKLPKNSVNKSWYKSLDTTDFSILDLSYKNYIEKDYVLNPMALCVFREK